MKSHISSTINAHNSRNSLCKRPASFALNNTTTNIKLDVQMNGSIVDPNLLAHETCASPISPIVHDFAHFDPYSRGPEGDPFSPPPPPPISCQTPEYSTPQHPRKRSKRGRKQEGAESETSCGLCKGNESRNKSGEQEELMFCSECGQSVHATCLGIDPNLGHVRHSYPWRCVECKICEVCQEKGDDNRILFCDHCDRGWHMDCIGLVIENPPEGDWICPECQPPLATHSPHIAHFEQVLFEPDTKPEPPLDPEPPAIPLDPQLLVEETPIRQSSVASSSHSRHASSSRKVRVQTLSIAEDPEEIISTPPPVDLTPVPLTYKRSRRQLKQVAPNHKPSPLRQRRQRQLNLSPPPPAPSGIRIRLPGRNKGKAREEEKSVFEDILNPEDRDTSKTTINDDDKTRFERSRQIAEEKQAALTLQHSTAAQSSPIDGLGPRTRRTIAPSFPSTPLDSPTPSSPGPSSTEHRVPRISTIRFGEFDIKTWYDAPFPEEYATIPDGRLWICEFCLKYMKSRFGAVRHKTKCKCRHPPGDEIYRDDAVSIFEVDGRKNKIYCQNLCLLSKMFLDHKSLFYDVEPFLFYIITESDDTGSRFVGYFSKEKWSAKDYNLSCIMTLPVRQRQGWGNLLIDFSYLLSKKEQRLGSPEKPLSSLGALGYRNYWTLALMRYLEGAPSNPRLEDICAATSLTIEDAFNTLQHLNMIVLRDVTPLPVKPTPGQSIKFPRGRKNGIARRALHREKTQEKEAPKGPFVPPKRYSIRWDRTAVMQHLSNWEAKAYLKLKPEKLKWSPFISSRKKTAAEGAMDISQLWTTERLSQLEREDWPPDVSIVDEDQPLSATTSPPGGETPVDMDEEIASKQEEATPPSTRRLLRKTLTRSVTAPRTASQAPAPRTRRTKSDSVRVSRQDDDLLPSYVEAQNSEDSDVSDSRSRSHSEGAGPLKRANSGRSALVRKRRRVESSPEMDDPTTADPPRSSSGPQEKSETVSQTGPVTPNDDVREAIASVVIESHDEIKSEDVLHPSDGFGKKGDHRLPFTATSTAEVEPLSVSVDPRESAASLDPSNEIMADEDEDAEGEPDDEFLGSGIIETS